MVLKLRFIIKGLFLLALLLSFIPIVVQAASAPLTTDSSTQVVQPQANCSGFTGNVCPTYRFTPSGGIYVSNNYNDNISLSPNIAGFIPIFSYNSTYFQYSDTSNGCSITYYFTNPTITQLTHKIKWSGCPSATWIFNIVDLKGYVLTLGSSGCEIIANTIKYSWCGASMSGATLSGSSSALTITITASSGYIDPTVNEIQTTSTTTTTSSTSTSTTATSTPSWIIPPPPFPDFFTLLGSQFQQISTWISSVNIYGVNIGILIVLASILAVFFVVHSHTGSRPKPMEPVNKVVITRTGGPTGLRMVLTAALSAALSSGVLLYVLPYLGVYPQIANLPLSFVLLIMFIFAIVAAVLVWIFTYSSTTVRTEPAYIEKT